MTSSVLTHTSSISIWIRNSGFGSDTQVLPFWSLQSVSEWLDEHYQSAKLRKKRSASDDRMAGALDAYRFEQAKPTGQKRGVRKIATLHGVNYSTLNRLARGGISQSHRVHSMQQSKSSPTWRSKLLLIGFCKEQTVAFHLPLRESKKLLMKY